MVPGEWLWIGRGDETADHWDGEAARDEGAAAASDTEGEPREGEDRRQSGYKHRPEARTACFHDRCHDRFHDRFVERLVPVAGVLDELTSRMAFETTIPIRSRPGTDVETVTTGNSIYRQHK